MDIQRGNSHKPKEVVSEQLDLRSYDPDPVILQSFPATLGFADDGRIVIDREKGGHIAISLPPTLVTALQEWSRGTISNAALVIEQIDSFDGVKPYIRFVSPNKELSHLLSQEQVNEIKQILGKPLAASDSRVNRLSEGEYADLGPTTDWDARYAQYRYLRDNAPIAYSPELNAWVVTRYADVLAAARDPRLDLNRIIPLKLQGLEPDVALSLSPVTDFLKTWMIYNEDPTHMQLKKQMSRVFHKDNVHPMKQVIVDTAHALIDRIVERHPDGKFDFVSEYAHPLPAIVLGTMLGVPHDGIERFLQWSDQLAAFMQDFVVSPRPNPMLVSATARAIEEMKEFFGAAVQARQRGSGPQDALADTVARTDLGESVVRNQCIHLMFGGHKVPEFLAGNLLQALLQNPHVFREVRKNRELINQATSEAIRYNSPIQFITRAANEQVPFHGQILQPGEQLMLYIASANRDERVFDSPDDFDIHRSQNKHLGFGAGTHACLGTPLVHLELHSMMDVLFDRFPKLELVYPDIPPAWMSNPTFHGLTSLMISFEN